MVLLGCKEVEATWTKSSGSNLLLMSAEKFTNLYKLRLGSYSIYGKTLLYEKYQLRAFALIGSHKNP